jgi:hypothetical protein
MRQSFMEEQIRNPLPYFAMGTRKLNLDILRHNGEYTGLHSLTQEQTGGWFRTHDIVCRFVPGDPGREN